jgi:hypothetical protein
LHIDDRFRRESGNDCGAFTGSIEWGERQVAEDAGSSTDRFVWSTDRYRLIIWLDQGQWAVQHSSPSPLLGPMLVSEARHKQAKEAVWEVLTRVTKATRDDDEGVRVATSAARWIREFGESHLSGAPCD